MSEFLARLELDQYSKVSPVFALASLPAASVRATDVCCVGAV